MKKNELNAIFERFNAAYKAAGYRGMSLEADWVLRYERTAQKVYTMNGFHVPEFDRPYSPDPATDLKLSDAWALKLAPVYVRDNSLYDEDSDSMEYSYTIYIPDGWENDC